MDHLAIMNPKWRLIEKIVAGQKTIESRWYVNKVAPWNKISAGDQIYFKDAGKAVTATAIVKQILQIEISNLETAITLVRKYKREISFTNESLNSFEWLKKKRYAILIFLANPSLISPFMINKTGYGNAAAWITLNDIEEIKL